ncbi:CorA family divalent cation transporter [Agromyces sp. NPDC127015]|uniref:CorA family divalent cation transporter n=1 Tax=Agromyces sp. NPDC127015 TaxID=3347108 RepID=UPI003661237E
MPEMLTGAGVWVRVVNPDPGELERLRERFGIHPLIIADLVEGRQAPKLERLSGHLYLNLWDVDRSGADPATHTDIALIFNDHECLVVQNGPEDELRDIEALLLADALVPVTSPISGVYRILDAVVQDFVELGAGVERELEEVEEEVFDSSIREDYRRIYRLRQRIGRIDRAVSGLAEAITADRGEFEAMMASEPALRAFFTHLEHDVTGVAKLATAEHAALDAVVSSHESNVSTRQNQDMRTISAFAALLAIPTVIAGVYGMNFKNLPLVQWEFGWLVVGIAMVAIDIVVYVLFRRRGWLGDRRGERPRPAAR